MISVVIDAIDDLLIMFSLPTSTLIPIATLDTAKTIIAVAIVMKVLIVA